MSKFNIAKTHGITWIKAEVIASTKDIYRVLTIFAAIGDIKLAAFEWIKARVYFDSNII